MEYHASNSYKNDSREGHSSLGYSSLDSLSHVVEEKKCENEELKETIVKLEKELKRKDQKIEILTNELTNSQKELERKDQKIEILTNELNNNKHQSQEFFEEFGQLKFESDRKARETKRKTRFEEIFHTKGMRSNLSNNVAGSLPVSTEQTSYKDEQQQQSTTDEECQGDITEVENEANHDNLANENICSITESNTNVPSPTNNELNQHFHALLDTIEKSLLSEDVSRLKEWAHERYSIEFENVFHVFRHLDENRQNLTVLRDFFESINRTDLIFRIDGFLEGQYDRCY